jgi:hypothetical protein
MKKFVLFALLFATVAAFSPVSAHAQAMPPLQNHIYTCDVTNPTQGDVDGTVWFSFVYLNQFDFKRGIEYFPATWGRDNRKADFAKPQDRYRINIRTGEYELFATDWEYTLPLAGVQCRARVTEWGGRISFSSCTDGSTRICY